MYVCLVRPLLFDFASGEEPGRGWGYSGDAYLVLLCTNGYVSAQSGSLPGATHRLCSTARNLPHSSFLGLVSCHRCSTGDTVVAVLEAELSIRGRSTRGGKPLGDHLLHSLQAALQILNPTCC
ncbi:hypothetical protein B0T21DRAFT_376233 [Apiosordaria backusii]|uniref:Uncharacterized protein n=1 Tax=Apiosordaria backusii TaxID=314023 RepID=A0AA40AAD3_9PEZI|nr:hypothetical protein B0T21DRAFT_376233 [Apiosordaria backusii]